MTDTTHSTEMATFISFKNLLVGLAMQQFEQPFGWKFDHQIFNTIRLLFIFIFVFCYHSIKEYSNTNTYVLLNIALYPSNGIIGGW